jgi:alpha-L-fucosidase 2
MKMGILLISLCWLCLGALSAFSQSANTLWYNKPAQYFEETLVLGNGRMGASVFGDVNSDKILLNDITLWSGEPVKADSWPDAYKNLSAVREALKNEDYALAEKLNRKLQGNNSQSYAPLGTLFLNFKNTGEPQNYYRELNIANAVSKVEYEVNGVKYTREYFISYPDQVMVIKLTSSKKGALDFNLQFTSQMKYKVSSVGEMLTVNGRAHIGNNRQGPIFDDNRGTRFSTLARIKNTGGKITTTDSTLVLNGGTEAIVYVSVATSFNGFDRDPSKDGKDDAALAAMQMDKAYKKSFKSLKNAHIEDYQKYFNRVSLYLGKTEAPNLPTNERLLRYLDGKEDKNLEVLYFQYGRYLLISSSRTKGVPANLQGLWNPYVNPPWRSNYTMNINVEENYCWLRIPTFRKCMMRCLALSKMFQRPARSLPAHFMASTAGQPATTAISGP